MNSAVVLAVVVVTGVLFFAPPGDDSQLNGIGSRREPVETNPVTEQQDEQLNQFVAAHPGTRYRKSEAGRLLVVYGRPFSHGETAHESAASFLADAAEVWGVDREALVPADVHTDRAHAQPIMYQRDSDSYKFTAIGYTQVVGEVPVFRCGLSLLVRNEDTFPLVMAGANMRDVAGLQVPADAEPLPLKRLEARASEILGVDVQVEAIELVVYAGTEDEIVAPTLGTKFIASSVGPTEPVKRLLVIDQAGKLLFDENQVHHIDVSGSVSGLATQDNTADACAAEALQALPYIQADVVGGNAVFADANGNFNIPHGGSSAVNVRARLRGQWFEVFDQSAGGAIPELTMSVTPPGPADFIFNAANSNESRRAGVNAYLSANQIREFVLSVLPTYPVIANQTFFAINVNIADTCNAFYDGISINFYASGGGCNNTAFAPIVYHEYGHHLLQSAGAGHGAYGEGMGDVMAMLLTGDPVLGRGFSTCGVGIRNADNVLQYPCDGATHHCGQLLSGCVWDTWQALGGPGTSGDDIIADLVVNSIVVRGQMFPGSSSIDPSITIIFLELDDDDADIGNGTPHYGEIATGFGLHNMDAPPLNLFSFGFPEGLPELILPGGGTTVRVELTPVTGSPVPGTGLLHYDIGAGFESIPMTDLSPLDAYDAVFPAFPCGTAVRYYFSAQNIDGQVVTYPDDAPADSLTTLSATSFTTVFSDDFESDSGWTVSGDATDGQWDRGVPVGGGDRGDPPIDADGSGSCYLTDNVDGNSDVDGGSTVLTSPMLDASNPNTIISYHRWHSNSTGTDPETDPFVVEVSDNNGATWFNLETVGPAGPEVAGGWYQGRFNLADVVGLTPSNAFRIRFISSDLGSGSVVESGVDAFALHVFGCVGADPCPADLTDDQTVDVQDLLAVLGAWGPCDAPCPPICTGDTNADCQVDVQDLLAVLGSWGSCPE